MISHDNPRFCDPDYQPDRVVTAAEDGQVRQLTRRIHEDRQREAEDLDDFMERTFGVG